MPKDLKFSNFCIKSQNRWKVFLLLVSEAVKFIVKSKVTI